MGLRRSMTPAAMYVFPRRCLKKSADASLSQMKSTASLCRGLSTRQQSFFFDQYPSHIIDGCLRVFDNFGISTRRSNLFHDFILDGADFTLRHLHFKPEEQAGAAKQEIGYSRALVLIAMNLE